MVQCELQYQFDKSDEVQLVISRNNWISEYILECEMYASGTLRTETGKSIVTWQIWKIWTFQRGFLFTLKSHVLEILTLIRRKTVIIKIPKKGRTF